MGRVDAQPVAVIVTQPHQGIVDEKTPDEFTALAIKVDSLAPRRIKQPMKIRGEFSEVVSFRPEMVVNHIQDDAQLALMACVDQLFESFRSAVAVVRRVQIDTVITPTAFTGEFRYRHDLDMSNAKRLQFAEPCYRRLKGALRREGSYMQLVDDRIR